MAAGESEFVHTKVPLEAMGRARHKWPDNVLDEGYTPFPKRLTRCIHRVFGEGLQFEHLAVVMAVVDYRRPNLTRNPSPEFLAFNAGLTTERFTECLEELRASGLLTFADDERGGLVVGLSGLTSRIVEETEKSNAG